MRAKLALLLLFIPLAAFGQAFGSWVVVPATDQTGDVVAATGNDKGKELLGYRCIISEKKCVYVLQGSVACNPGHEYPMLMNAPSGSALVTAVCSTGSNANEFLLVPYNVIEKAIKGGGTIGFAVPLESGAFRALRFDADGGGTAIAETERQARRNTPQQRSTRSTTF